MLQRFQAFGIAKAKVVAAQAMMTSGLALAGAVVVLAVAAPTYGIPAVADPAGTALGLAAQAIGLLAFLPLYLLGGGGPSKGVMTGPMQSIA